MLIINKAIEQWVFDNPTLRCPLQLDDHDWDTLFAIADILRVWVLKAYLIFLTQSLAIWGGHPPDVL